MTNSIALSFRKIPMLLSTLDGQLLDFDPRRNLAGVRRFAAEFLYFGIKEARACLFVVCFFAAVFSVPRAGVWGLPRYDVLLIIAVAIQAGMIWAKLETFDELKAICLFHGIGFALEVFKTSGGIQSWAYPDFAYSKVFGVPLFSGFMYAAVGSYVIQAWRLLDVRIRHHPRIGWPDSMRCSSMPISSRTTILVITGGISPPVPWAYMRERQWSSGRWIGNGACRFFWRSC
jgi:uncharacterized protein DUF817